MRCKDFVALAAFALMGGSAVAEPCEPVDKTSVVWMFEVRTPSKELFNELWRCVFRQLPTNPIKGIEIHLGPGLYRLDEPLEIPRSLALRNISLTISGTGATLSGAKPVSELRPYPATALEKDVLVAQLPPSIARQFLGSVLRDHGSLPAVAPVNLLVDGQIRWRTEWPEKTYLRLSSTNEDLGTISSPVARDIELSEGMQVQGFLRHDWADATRNIDVSQSARSGDLATLDIGTPWPKYGAVSGGRFKLLNSPQHVPGTLGTAYIPANNSFVFQGPANKEAVEYTAVTELIRGSQVADLTIRDLTLTGARHTAVVLRGRNILIENTHFRDNGISALAVDATNVLIERSTFVRHGGTPVLLQGGDRATLEPSNIQFVRNEIADFGNLIWSSVPGLRMNGVGILTKRNLVYNGPHAGIFYFGNDHQVLENELHTIATRTGDVGAIYTGRDWTGRGHRVEGNFVHDITGVGELKATAIYLDDQASGIVVTNNLVVNAPRGVLIGGGRDNRVEHNHFAQVPICVRADARGEEWQASASAAFSELNKRLGDVPYQSELWQSRYPALQDVAFIKTGSPLRNLVQGNLGEPCEWIIDESLRSLGSIKNNINVPKLRYSLSSGAVGPASAGGPPVPLFRVFAQTPR